MAEKKKNDKTALDRFFENKAAVAVVAVLILAVLFACAFFVTTAIVKKSGEKPETPSGNTVDHVSRTEPENDDPADIVSPKPVDTTTAAEETTTSAPAETTTAAPTADPVASGQTISFPSDTASWQLICLNRNRCVDASAEDSISLSYVAGSEERMDSRAAAAYEKMYDAAASDGIYLTPCSGYRSYSTQKRLYQEFVDEYLNQGYSQQEAEDLASNRRNPPGSSEHNIGICMDIICASSSANFQNTSAYAWLQANAADYGFILRYPEDKVDITGVKFEPWHWRYVGVENAAAIKNSGLCLEEYLGVQ